MLFMHACYGPQYRSEPRRTKDPWENMVAMRTYENMVNGPTPPSCGAFSLVGVCCGYRKANRKSRINYPQGVLVV